MLIFVSFENCSSTNFEKEMSNPRYINLNVKIGKETISFLSKRNRTVSEIKLEILKITGTPTEHQILFPKSSKSLFGLSGDRTLVIDDSATVDGVVADLECLVIPIHGRQTLGVQFQRRLDDSLREHKNNCRECRKYLSDYDYYKDRCYDNYILGRYGDVDEYGYADGEPQPPDSKTFDEHEKQIYKRYSFTELFEPLSAFPTVYVCISEENGNLIKLNADEITEKSELCTVESIKELFRQHLKSSSSLSSVQMFLFVEIFRTDARSSYTEIIQNDNEWLALIESCKKANIGNLVRLGLGVFSHPSVSSNLPRFGSFAQIPYIEIRNTCGRALTKWYPDNSNCHIAGLQRFVESKLGIPSQLQVFYHDCKMINGHKTLLSLMLKNRNEPGPFIIHLAYKTFPASVGKLNEAVKSSIQELALQKLQSVRIKDEATHLVVIDNILDFVQNPTIEIKEISDIVTETLRSSISVSIEVNMDRYSNESIEDMFYSNDEFKESLDLFCKIKSNDYPCLRKYLFEVNGLKTLVVKSLTRTFEIDTKFQSIEGIKDHFAWEWKIPRHCQVYVHGEREIAEDEQIFEIFRNFSSEEEKLKKCLYLNLITLEPNDITVSLNCPYRERIGLPATIAVKETLTIGDLEKSLSDMTLYDISLHPRKLSTPEDQLHLFTLPPHFIAYRPLEVYILTECIKCRKPDTIIRHLVITNSSETVHNLMTQVHHQNQTIHCSCGFDMPVKFKLSNKNSEITERTKLLDIPAGQLVILRAQPTLSTRLRGAIGFY